MPKLNRSKPILVVALGGNALIKRGQQGTIEEQFENLKGPVRQIARLSRDFKVVITHGNGPQVGHLMLQQECCPDVPELPLEILVAQTEGQIGYMIESSLDEALMELDVDFRPLVSMITYVVVNRDDPAFTHPSKPIGPVLNREQARRARYPVIETPLGYRRVVASPEPMTIVEKREIRTLIDLDFIVICCGGGGIPVIREGRAFEGVDAVVDKDLASLRLALEIGADRLVIATDVAGVMQNFGRPEATLIRRLSLADARRLSRQGAFGPGSMLPKVEAAAGFVEQTRKPAAITDLEHIAAAARGRAGTRFVQ